MYCYFGTVSQVPGEDLPDFSLITPDIDAQYIYEYDYYGDPVSVVNCKVCIVKTHKGKGF